MLTIYFVPFAKKVPGPPFFIRTAKQLLKTEMHSVHVYVELPTMKFADHETFLDAAM